MTKNTKINNKYITLLLMTIVLFFILVGNVSAESFTYNEMVSSADDVVNYYCD